MPHAAGTVSRNAMVAINADLRNVPEFNAILCNHSSGTKWVTPFFSSMLLPRFTSHSSTDSRIIGTHKPVSKNAEKIPNAASTPNDRSTAISLKRFAANAAIVVTEVRQIARPTRCSVISAAVCEDLPFIRSSLYRCNACRESSMPSARTRIGNRFENCERAMMDIPNHEVMLEKCPIIPCIHSRAVPSANMTMTTSETLRRLT